MNRYTLHDCLQQYRRHTLYQDVTVQYLILKSQVFVCCYNNLSSFVKTFHKTLEPGRLLLPLNLNSIMRSTAVLEATFGPMLSALGYYHIETKKDLTQS